MKYILLKVVFLFLFCSVGFAQDSLLHRNLAIKIAPLSMLDIDNTFQLGIEHRLKGNRWTLSEEFGYGAAAANLWMGANDNSKLREVFRAKVEARKYKQAFTGTYVAYEAFYKQVNDRLQRGIGRECEDGWCNYFENINYPVSKYVIGATAKLGYQTRFKNELKHKGNFIFDIYVGLGLRRKIIDHAYDEELDSQSSWFYRGDNIYANNGFGYKDRKYNIPHFSLGIKFGYLIF